LLKACEEACRDLHLNPSEAFLGKVIQLYETVLVRHGLMLVGPTMAGKTCAYRVLQAVSDFLVFLSCENYVPEYLAPKLER
jgi:Hydrolytic ATP binding site of dynein motor region